MFAPSLERARQLFAENEWLEQQIIDDYSDSKVSSVKDDVAQSQRLKIAFNRIIQNSSELLKYYKDEDRIREEELRGLVLPDDHISTTFYDAIRKAKELHRSTPTNSLDQFPTLPDVENEFPFTGEEFGGKYLDLQLHFQAYCNIDGLKKIKYTKYLKSFYEFESIPRQHKSGEYHRYVSSLGSYLLDFHSRIYPLYPAGKILACVKENFDEKMEAAFFCQPCQRSFAKDSLFKNHCSGKKHKKMVARIKDSKNTAESVEFSEEKVRVLTFLLKDRVVATIQFVEAMQTRTYAEIRAERTDVSEDSAEEDEEDSDGDDGVIHNPLKIPLGWDGKPIPYWLYKLHGLNIEYNCEICGNYSYWGPRAFERHFKEWRHLNGMKALGIINSEEFKNITGIQDAIALFQKLQTLDKYKTWQPELDEEFEDADGNVYNKKTYDDLKRQGLL